jgi:predicted ArsR family transcriptional regulator
MSASLKITFATNCPVPLRPRIFGALKLAPLSTRALANMLSTTENYVRQELCRMRRDGIVQSYGFQRPAFGRNHQKLFQLTRAQHD